nr:hypothetical protein [Tanacetum cinerariifolium]
ESLSHAGNPIKEILLKVESIRSQVNPHGFAGSIKWEWRYLFPAEPQFITICSYPTIKSSATLMYSNKKFSLSIGELVTHWFTLIVLSALRRSDNENMLSLVILILRSILTNLQETSKGSGDTCFPAEPQFITTCSYPTIKTSATLMYSKRKYFRLILHPISCVFVKLHILQPSTNNEDKVFNSGILIQENPFEVITRVAPDKNVKKIDISHASLILEDFDPPLYELPFHKEVPGTKTLLLLSSENQEKVFKLGILTAKGVHSSLLPELSH